MRDETALNKNTALIARKWRFYLNTLKRSAVCDNPDAEGTAKLTIDCYFIHRDSNTTWTWRFRLKW